MSDRLKARRAVRRGVTMVEILAVIAIIIILMAILLPSLLTAKGNATVMQSLHNMKQIATYMEAYAKDNRETIVPSAFDYSAAVTPGKVRTNRKPDGTEPPPPLGMLHKGTWADIIWTDAGLGPINTGGNYDWRYDAPDGALYALQPDFDKNPLRSVAPLKAEFTADMSTSASINNNDLGSRALPQDVGQPGYFAANNFFDSRAGNWYTTSQIRRPAAALYLVDSLAGETIDPVDNASGLKPWWGSDPLCQVDFRYVGNTAAILFLDSHTDTQPKWDKLEELQGVANTPTDHGRGIRVTNLDQH